jgi:uncharacterized caspase-like protein
MTGKYALIIGNTEYSDSGLAQLTAPGRDAEDFARVLKDQAICGFDDVKLVMNQPEHVVRGMIDEFFDQKKTDDLLVLYFSGHGVRDELGALYLAVQNTIRTRLRSTAVKSDYIRDAMDQSRSKRQVLILDCCNSGAFAQGTKAATGVTIGTASAFEAGYGRIILTASDSTQFAWEGNRVIGETDNSLFTHYLVEGLKGEADLDGDGSITVDELYDYAYEKVKLATPKQTPSKFSSKQQGEIVLRQSMRLEDIKSFDLPAPLLDSIENPFADIRLGAVQQLAKMMNGKNLGLARSAREALQRIAEHDDSRQVSRAAAQALGYQPSLPKDPSEAEAALPPPAQKDEAAELETGKAAALPGRQALMTLGWTIAGAIGGASYNAIYGPLNAPIAGAVGGAIGGLVTAFAFQNWNALPKKSTVLPLALIWAIAGLLGWGIGEFLTEVSGIAIGSAIGASVGVAALLRLGFVSFDWKPIAAIILGWAAGAGIGWLIAKTLLIEGLGVDFAVGWPIGMGIGWGIAGFVMGWQLSKQTQ